MIESCHTCQMTSSPPCTPPVTMSKLPDGPWKKVGLDLSGLYGSNNEYVLAIIDYYSRFPIAEIIQSTSSAAIINKLRQTFAMHGLVDEIVTDNASSLVSSEFESFLREHGIKHSRISPYWSRNNGLVENFNCSIRKADVSHRSKRKTGELNYTRSFYIIARQNTVQLASHPLDYYTIEKSKLNYRRSTSRKHLRVSNLVMPSKNRKSSNMPTNRRVKAIANTLLGKRY